jgi:hypothetical protein
LLVLVCHYPIYVAVHIFDVPRRAGTAEARDPSQT